jgi:ABC-2 type transport system ATP-binding protein
MLEVVDVSKRLGARLVLQRVRMSCGPSEVAVVVGENGAGKSTLLRVVSGILEPDAGEVRIGGASMRDGGVAARRALGYVPDATDALPDLMVAEFVKLVGELKGVATGRRDGPHDPLGAHRARLGLDSVWHQRLSTLSFGQRKRACVLAALIGDPWLLVLDEPSNGLDPVGTAVMRSLVEDRRAAGKATLLTTNDVAFVESIEGTRYELREAVLRRVETVAPAEREPGTV